MTNAERIEALCASVSETYLQCLSRPSEGKLALHLALCELQGELIKLERRNEWARKQTPVISTATRKRSPMSRFLLYLRGTRMLRFWFNFGPPGPSVAELIREKWQKQDSARKQ
jgi:hypothetical protein